MTNITFSEAELIATHLYECLNDIDLIDKPIAINESETDKFGFTSSERTPVLTITFKNPKHGADFYREFMLPLSLIHEPPETDLSVCTIRLEITSEHALLTDPILINSLLLNVLRSIKENFMPRPRK